MTRKDYNLIAQSLRENKPTPILENYSQKMEMFYQLVHNLAVDLKNENDRFDYYKFMGACGLKNYSLQRGNGTKRTVDDLIREWAGTPLVRSFKIATPAKRRVVWSIYPTRDGLTAICTSHSIGDVFVKWNDVFNLDWHLNKLYSICSDAMSENGIN